MRTKLAATSVWMGVRAILWVALIFGPVGLRAAEAGPDPWTAADLMQPETLAKLLAGPASERPTVICVGVPMLFRNSHIVGAQFAGPGSRPEGLKLLAETMAKLPQGAPVVIYCGCCPWQHCPNIRPAFQALRDKGYANVHVLVIPTNFHDDWVAKGFPVEKGETR